MLNASALSASLAWCAHHPAAQSGLSDHQQLLLKREENGSVLSASVWTANLDLPVHLPAIVLTDLIAHQLLLLQSVEPTDAPVHVGIRPMSVAYLLASVLGITTTTKSLLRAFNKAATLCTADVTAPVESAVAQSAARVSTVVVTIVGRSRQVKRARCMMVVRRAMRIVQAQPITAAMYLQYATAPVLLCHHNFRRTVELVAQSLQATTGHQMLSPAL